MADQTATEPSQAVEVPPVRYCHGCGVYDDHPRVIDAPNWLDAQFDKLYHVDCAPGHVITPNVEPILAHRKANKANRGVKLREFAVGHAATIAEAPADTPEKG